MLVIKERLLPRASKIRLTFDLNLEWRMVQRASSRENFWNPRRKCRPKPMLVKFEALWRVSNVATLSNCGKSLKLHTPSDVRKGSVARVMTSGTVTAVEMQQWVIRSQVLRAQA